MLKDLTLLNAQLSIEFNSLLNIYTVSVDNEITSLDISYECLYEECEVKILNNDILLEGENEVIINVSGEDYFDTYTLIVTRKTSSTVFYEQNIDNLISLENNTTSYPYYKVEYLIFIVLVLIITLFYFIIAKKKKKA